jgi:hypothetical protein
LEKKPIKNPGEVIFSACAFMKYWAGLFPEESHNLVAVGTDLMMKMTKSILDGRQPIKKIKLLTAEDARMDNQEKAMIVRVPGMGGEA